MGAIVFNLTTALLLVLTASGGLALVGRDTIPRRRIPWAAVALTVPAVAGVVDPAVLAGGDGRVGQRPRPPRLVAGCHVGVPAERRCGRSRVEHRDARGRRRSSGATYFLGATLTAPLLVRTRVPKERLLAIGAVALGLAMWLAQDNGHGLVVVYGFTLGAVVWALGHNLIHPERDLARPARVTMGSIPGVAGKR